MHSHLLCCLDKKSGPGLVSVFTPPWDLIDSSLLLLGGLWPEREGARRLTEEREKKILKGNHGIRDVTLPEAGGSFDGSGAGLRGTRFHSCLRSEPEFGLTL